MGNICCWGQHSIQTCKDIQIVCPNYKSQFHTSSDYQRTTGDLSLSNLDNFSLSCANPFKLPQRIRWRKGDLIGEGSYAKVYQCINLDSGEIFAIKSIKFESLEWGNEWKQINQEINLLKDINHKNIIKYYQTDIDYCKQTVDIVVEYVSNGTLKKLINKYGKLEIGIIRNYAKQILNGLVYIHDKRIIHRDLKPANILITGDGIIKLTDFGSSKKIDKNKSRNKTGSMKGSPYWMAPEIALKKGHSISSDIWSLGCVIIDMATGKPPWSNYSQYTKDVLKMLRSLNHLPDIPNTDPNLEDFIRACLKRNPRERPTAKQLLGHKFLANYHAEVENVKIK
ncbi:unnamed protein product [Blepharisma stoltei]|uniref:Protein kinase domain-containing protein n=1 Tax=Blepharisma stoltei TaxID=1481888 RepID=A0AAU9JI79_9CILI|nr:unnamed protein product [Blepharisma stoltei]